MAGIDSTRQALNIEAVKADGTQDIKLYDYKTKALKTVNVSKEKADEYVATISKAKKKTGRTLAIATSIGAIGLTTLGAVIPKKLKVLTALTGLVIGTLSGYMTGAAIAIKPAAKKIMAAQEKLIN